MMEVTMTFEELLAQGKARLAELEAEKARAERERYQRIMEEDRAARERVLDGLKELLPESVMAYVMLPDLDRKDWRVMVQIMAPGCAPIRREFLVDDGKWNGWPFEVARYQFGELTFLHAQQWIDLDLALAAAARVEEERQAEQAMYGKLLAAVVEDPQGEADDDAEMDVEPAPTASLGEQMQALIVEIVRNEIEAM